MTQTQTERSRTFSWTDPKEHAKLFVERSGLDVLRAMAAGEVPPPPIFQLIDGNRLQVEPGSVTVTLDPQEFHYNPIGTVHGGIISTLLDTAAACSVQSTLAAGIGYTSMDLNVKFLRPVTVDTGLITCTGAVLQQGRRTALAEARLTDARNRLLAHATSTCLLFDLPTP
ncbi:phenylacetic acid degradation protein [Actinoplanes cyaneus]|uniref:Phenylacetic acid degradation protein n=1 Tax=Actinoplanes cyaneus TaxID=52696 RepID=A0A919IGZ3_9ACTN|nr:PaaI family thioesterase [Actinoplanes cyaneus]MCW2139351.1 putative domain 1-containing protein [Actinoplanes cyaneus]GID65880.1 phenylacetic acid degradation protein [Actinoplanes cyaneus]